MSLPSPEYFRWTEEELRNAECAAISFLDANIQTIADTFQKRVALLNRVVASLRSEEASYEQRMLYLSLVQEISEGMGASAREFFEIGCLPTVAHTVYSPRRKQ